MGFLRTFLAICVILEHSHPAWKFQFLSGEVAVKTFFIISGFYMSLILASKYVGKNSYTLFISNRFLRIYPLYWSVVILTIIASAASGVFSNHWMQLAPYNDWGRGMGLSAWAMAILSNLLIFGQDVVMFLGLNVKTGGLFFTENFRHVDHAFYIFLFIPQSWTLALELMFYLMAPLIVNKSIWLVLVLIAGSLLVGHHIYSGLGWTWDPWTFRFFPSELLFFLLGNLSFRIYKKIKDRPDYRSMGLFLTSAFFLFAFIYPNVHWPIPQEYAYGPYYCFAFLSLPFIFNLTKNIRADSRLGELSYPIYLVHYLIIWVVRQAWAGQSNDFKIILTIVMSILLSCILLRLIVDPIDSFRQSRWAKRAQG